MADTSKITTKLIEKGALKTLVSQNTSKVFNDIKRIAKTIALDSQNELKASKAMFNMDYNDTGDFSAELKFDCDQLLFVQHTNIFQFPREHEIMKTPYIKNDPHNSYCGIIKIYNFLSDSFKYNRGDDVGYLIARIFINKDFHFFVEGKRQAGLFYNNFQLSIIDDTALKTIIESAILYSLDFDLLTPPYDSIKEVTVQEMQMNNDANRQKTGKRLGFRFQIDNADTTSAK